MIARLPGQALGTCALRRADRARSCEQAQRDVARARLQHRVRVASLLGHDAQKPYALAGPGTDALPDGSPLDGSTAIRGGIGSDPGCLRPGGAPGFANALSTRRRIALRRGDQRAPVPVVEPAAVRVDLPRRRSGSPRRSTPGACAWTFFATATICAERGTSPFGEAFTSMFAGDPDGPTSGPPTTRSCTIPAERAVQSGRLIAFPFASLNRLRTTRRRPSRPQRQRRGRQRRGLRRRRSGARRCDLGGFDGFDGRIAARAASRAPPTLDSSLTNEQRALLGCGPFYGTRCDSARRARPTDARDLRTRVRAAALDFLNMEARCWCSRGRASRARGPGRRSPTLPSRARSAARRRACGRRGRGARGNVPFLGGPGCTRFVASRSELVKLPGCRGIESLSVVYNDPTASPAMPTTSDARQVAFEPGYLPSIDGCILGDVIRQRGGAPSVPVTAVGRVAAARRRARAVQRRDRAPRRCPSS